MLAKFIPIPRIQCSPSRASNPAPTDPKIVVDIFETLINTPAGERPLRTIAGLDFGAQAMNDAIEPIRVQGLAEMGLSDKVHSPE